MKSLKIVIAAISLLLCFSASAQEQSGMKVLTIQDNPILESPLSIEVYLNGKRIKSDQPFKADDNWIGDLQIFVTNRTDDEIKFVSFTLDFPTTHNGEEMMKRFRIAYGKDTAFKIEDTPDAEDRRIAKRDSAVVTFNSNNPLSFEGFKNFKRTSPYDPKIFDHGILSVYAVEFENRAWLHGFDFDRQSDGSWQKNKEKEKKLIERIKKAKKEEESRIGMLGRPFLPKAKSAATCYTVGNPVGVQIPCTALAGCPPPGGCQYFKPNLIHADVGVTQIKISAPCKKSSVSCGCCEPNVGDVGSTCSTE